MIKNNPIIVASYAKIPRGTKTGAGQGNPLTKFGHQITNIRQQKNSCGTIRSCCVTCIMCRNFFCCFAPQAVQIFHRFCSQSLCFKLSFTNFLPETDHLPPHRANAQEADQEQDRADETNFPPFRLGNITGAEVNGSRAGCVMG